MKPRLDLNKIAKTLGAKCGGKVVASGGYLGALQLLASLPPKTTKRLAKTKRKNLLVRSVARAANGSDTDFTLRDVVGTTPLRFSSL
jgi:hypothetical protein